MQKVDTDGVRQRIETLRGQREEHIELIRQQRAAHGPAPAPRGAHDYGQERSAAHQPSPRRFPRMCLRAAAGTVLAAVLGASLTACGSLSSGVRAAPAETASVSATPEVPALAVPGTGTIPVPNGPAASPGSELPEDIAKAAADFTAAWASHDARPGQDKDFTDAGRRASQYTSEDLGASLSAARPSTTAQWRQWTEAKASVVASVTAVSVPDGAPAPTSTSALARVFYRVTTSPASGKSTTTDSQVALLLERGHDGRWRVIALPYA